MLIEVSGNLKEYITLEYDEFILKPHENNCQEYTVRFPEILTSYGNNQVKIWAKQKVASDEGSFIVRANIHHKLSIFVPYPDKYVTMEIHTEDVNINEPVQFRITAQNFGSIDVSKSNVRLDIFGADDYSNFITSLYSDNKPIASMETVNYYLNLETVGLVPGYYQAQGELFYDGSSTGDVKIFKIGTLFVRINNYTSDAVAQKINPFEITIESRWNNKIESLYGKVEFEGILQTINTQTISLQPWQTFDLKSFLDLSDTSEGDYKGKITLFYGDQTTSQDILLHVAESKSVEKQTEPEIHKDIPEDISLTGKLSLTNILLVIIVLMIIIDLGYIYYKRTKNEKK